MLFADIIITEDNVQITVCRQVDRNEFEDEEETPHLFECIKEKADSIGVVGRTYEGFIDEDPRVLNVWSPGRKCWVKTRSNRFRRIR